LLGIADECGGEAEKGEIGGEVLMGKRRMKDRFLADGPGEGKEGVAISFKRRAG
jgi:hypothetical protein